MDNSREYAETLARIDADHKKALADIKAYVAWMDEIIAMRERKRPWWKDLWGWFHG